MGKSYVRIKYTNGTPVYVSRMGAKVPKASLHDRHQSHKTCRVCRDPVLENRGKEKKYYESHKHLTDTTDFKLRVRLLKTIKQRKAKN
jgi:hypothetical protein